MAQAPFDTWGGSWGTSWLATWTITPPDPIFDDEPLSEVLRIEVLTERMIIG